MTTSILRTLHTSERERWPRWIEYPERVTGLELHGPLPDTGFERQQWLASRGKHHFALTPVVYHVLAAADGRTSASDIAAYLTTTLGQLVSADDVRWLVEHRLAPAGLVRCPTLPAAAAAPAAKKPKPLLSIRARVPLLRPEWIAPITAVLQHLFWPPLAIASLTLITLVHVWLYTAGNDALGGGWRSLFIEPRWILIVFAMELGCSLFHEFGHAAAMRRSRCPHGPIGFGLYLVWPVFYTDVTPIYRLRRSERLRVDLGGMYFHQLAALGCAGLYLVTGWPVWLLGVLIADVQCLRQLNPFLRFDGYYILADLLGVPDPLSQIKPFLRSLWRRTSDGLQLRRTTRLLFAGYLGIVVIYFFLPYAIGIEYGREIAQTIWTTGRSFGPSFAFAWAQGDALLLAAVAVQFVFWTFSVLGLALFLWSAGSLSVSLAKRGARLLVDRR